MAERKKAKLYATARWQRLRRQAFAKSVYCMYCYTEYPKIVDHMSGCPADNRIENLIPCCKKCHDKKTQRIDVFIRLISMHSLDDALIYAAKKMQHDFNIASLSVLQNMTPTQLAIYETIKANSMHRPPGLLVSNSTTDDIRYVVVLAELSREYLNQNPAMKRRNQWQPKSKST